MAATPTHDPRPSAVIDSTTAGLDAGSLLDGTPSGIPIVATLAAALQATADMPLRTLGSTLRPNVFIVGIAPLDGRLGDNGRIAVLEAIHAGLEIVSGLHECLGYDAEIAAAAHAADVPVTDVRKPASTVDLRTFDGTVGTVDCLRIAVLGTDGAVGKRTTCTALVAALNGAGIPTVLIPTGQTGLMQGGAYGVALDAIAAQFAIGELQGQVLAGWKAEHPRVMVIEGQGTLSHPAYISSAVIFRATKPHGVVLQHAPMRKTLSDYPNLPVPSLASEIALIELFGDTKVVGVTLNHEFLTRETEARFISKYSTQLGVPVVDAVWSPESELVGMVAKAFPALMGGADEVVA